MTFLKGLRSKGSGREYPKEALYVCEYDFSPLEADYDYAAIKRSLSREKIQKGPKSLWRYRDLLPIDGEPTCGLQSGFTPLIKADRLAKLWDVKELYIKDDTVCHPTWSFKDRVVAVALSRLSNSAFRPCTWARAERRARWVSGHSAAAAGAAKVADPARARCPP